MKWLLIPFGILVCCIVLIFIIGWLLPVKHTAGIRIHLPTSPTQVWQRITGFSDFPQWRSDLQSVQILTDSTWVEIDKRRHQIPYRLEIIKSDHQLITRIDGVNLPFGGSWTYTLEPEGQGTVLSIVENGEVYNPLFRFVSRFIIGQTATLKKYAVDIKRSFAEN